MAHVVAHPTSPFLVAHGKLEIHQIPASQDNLIWLAVSTDTGAACVVDGPEWKPVEEYCERRGLRPTTIVNTHTHHDHIGINRDLARLGELGAMDVVGPSKVARSVPGITIPVSDGDEVDLAGAPARVWLTEGHLNGHVSYVLDGAVFCGDTLFAGGCGFLYDGPPRTMFESLRRLMGLPGDTKVCCAHEYTQDNLRFAWSLEPDNPALRERIQSVWALRARGRCAVPSTIDEEIATNPFLRWDSPELVSNLRSLQPDVALDKPQDVFAATRSLKDRKDYRAIREADLPL